MPLTDEQLTAFAAGEAVYQEPERGFAVDDVFDWAAGTVVDIGKTMWNSLTPDSWDTETDDILTSLGFADAARFYQENRDLIEASSFFGGLLIPFGPASLATRAVKLMRSGKLASVRGNPFGAFDRKLQSNLQQTKDLIAAGEKATGQYKRLRRERMFLVGGEAVIDSFATEAMIAGLINEHAWLKDYSPTEFVLGGFLGAGIVAPLRWISDSSALARFGSDIELGQVQDVAHLQSSAYPKWQDGATTIKQSRARLDELEQALATTPSGSDGFRQGWLERQVATENKRFLDTVDSLIEPRARPKAERPPAEGALFEIGERAGTVDESSKGELVALLRGDPSANALDGVQRIRAFRPDSSLADEYVVAEFSNVRLKEVPATTSGAADTEVRMSSENSAQLTELLYGRREAAAKQPRFVQAKAFYEASQRAKTGVPKVDVTVDGAQRMQIAVDKAADLKHPDVQRYVQAILDDAPLGATLVSRSDHKLLQDLWQRKVLRTGKPRERDRITGALRPGDDLPVKVEDPSAVFDPWLQRIVSSVDSAITMRAADAQHQLAKRFDFSKNYDPLGEGQATWQADSSILDAVNASRAKAFREASDPLTFGLGDVPQLAAMAAAKRFTNATIGGATVESADDFLAVAKQSKATVIQRLAEKGYAPEQIAIYTATPQAMVDTFIAARFDTSAIADAKINDLFTYVQNDRAYLSNVLRKGKLKLEGESVRSQAERQNNPASAVDEVQKGAAEDAFIFEAVNQEGTPSQFLDLYDQNFKGDSLRILKEGVRQAISTFKVGNRFFGSADQALRSFGETGIVATSVGTNTSRAAQRLAGEVTSKLAPLGRAIQMDRTGRSQAQFHAFMEAYRSRSGKQMEGSFYDVTTGRVRLADGSDLTHPATGKPVEVAADSQLGRFVSSLQDTYNPISRAARDVNRRLVGETTATAKGLYIPYAPMDEKLIAYIFDPRDVTRTRVITARSPEQLATFVKEAEKTKSPEEVIALSGAKGDSEREAFEAAHGYVRGGGRLEKASSREKKSGVATVAPTPTADEVNDIIDAIAGEMHNTVRNFTHHSLGRVFRDLDEIERYHQRFEKAGNKGVAAKSGLETHNGATTLKRTLLNMNPQDSDSAWGTLAQGFDQTFNYALNALNRSILGNLVKTPVRREADFDDMVAQLREEGAPVAWADFDSYLRSNVPAYSNMSKQFVNTMSGLMTTLNLKILEFAHAAVTTLSAPVILSGELAASRTAQQGVISPLKYMTQAVKTSLSSEPNAVRIRERMRERGYGLAHIAEASDVMHEVAASPGLIGGTLDAVDSFNRSKVVELLSSPTNWAERWTREIAYYTGYHMAKDVAPGVSEELAEHQGQAFVKRAMGNYTTAQRPAMFQGTLGQSLGLYQTFMLTMGQQVYRHLERQDGRALALLFGAQGAMFGLESLPGYEFMNTQLQDHVLKDDMSLRSTAYRLFGDSSLVGQNMAELFLYGVPSTVFDTALTSRATLDVRLPFGLGETGELSIIPPIASGLVQSIGAMGTLGSQLAGTLAASGGAWDYGTAFTQAISMQSMWRPGARVAEIFQGFTMDRNGRIVDNDTRDNGIFSLGNLGRVTGARPLHEHALRQARYSNRYLDARDRENRRSATTALRRWAVDPGGSQLSVGAMFQDYMDNGGSAQGWTGALNQAHRDASTSQAVSLRKEIDRRSPLQDIVDTYIY